MKNLHYFISRVFKFTRCSAGLKEKAAMPAVPELNGKDSISFDVEKISTYDLKTIEKYLREELRYMDSISNSGLSPFNHPLNQKTYKENYK